MGKEIKREIIKDEIGEHELIEYSNGIKAKILLKPSAEYKKKSERIKKETEEKRKKRLEEKKKENLIKDKMREMAIKELEKEGKI